jgi:hypothetical protein
MATIQCSVTLQQFMNEHPAWRLSDDEANTKTRDAKYLAYSAPNVCFIVDASTSPFITDPASPSDQAHHKISKLYRDCTTPPNSQVRIAVHAACSPSGMDLETKARIAKRLSEWLVDDSDEPFNWPDPDPSRQAAKENDLRQIKQLVRQLKGGNMEKDQLLTRAMAIMRSE